MTVQPQVLVDGRVISHPTAGGRGVGRYTIGLVRAMHESGAMVTVMNASEVDEQKWLDAIPTLRVAPFEPSTVREASPDTWFMCTQMMLHPIPLDVVPRMITEAGLRVVGILHDVIPYRYPDQYLCDPSALRQSQLRAMLVRTFDAMVANSSFSADTGSPVLDFNRSQIHVVGAAVEPQFCEGLVSELRLQRLIDKGVELARGLVVAVTGGDDRKNTPRLIRAWGSINGELRKSHQLVIACAAVPVVQNRWRNIANSVGLTEHDVVFTDTVTDDDVKARTRLDAIITVIDTGSTDARRGFMKEFEAIIAAVIGGCLLTGGYGSAIGAFFGAIIFGMVVIGLSYTNFDQDWFQVFLGGMLLIAVLFNNYIRKRVTGER